MPNVPPLMQRCATCGAEWWDAHLCPKSNPMLPLTALPEPAEDHSVDGLANGVCRALPEGWELRLCMERGAAWVTLHDPEGERLQLPDAADKCLERQVADALRVAQGQ